MCAETKNKGKLNILHGVISAGIVALIFVAVLVVSGITPFGDGTFLMFDLKRQYVDYYAYYKTLVRGENNVRYSFSTTLGSGTIGFFAYYLTSPFLVLLSLFDQTHISTGITIVIGLKLMLAAFFMDCFLQWFIVKARSLLPVDLTSAALYMGAVSWAFSGFLFAHSMNLMWTDVVVLLPIYILCLEVLIRDDRRAPFIVLLWCMLILNYYITFQVILFTVLWTVMRVLVCGYDRKLIRIFRVALCGVVAGAMSAALLLPTGLELMDSPKDITQLGLTLTGKNLTPLDVFSKLPTLAYDYIEARFGYPQIYCGILLVFLTLMYFMNRRIARGERIGMLVLMSLLMASFCLDILNIVWHAGMEPSGHPYRQAYLFVFMMIICSVRAFSTMDRDIGPVPMGISFAVMVVTLYFIRLGRYDHISDYSVMASYALIIFYAAVFILFLLSAGRKKKLIPVLLLLILLANCADLAANALYTYHYQAMLSEKAGEYSSTVSQTLEAVDHVKKLDSSFYRMENLHPRQQNDSLQYAYNGITHYSSAGMIYVRYFLQRLGFNDDTLYTSYGKDNTETADSLLGIKYHVTDDTALSHHDYQKIFDSARDVYENPYPLTVAIQTRDYDLKGISDPEYNRPDTGMSHVPALDAFALQEEMYSRLLGRKVDIFRAANVNRSDLQKESDKFVYNYDVETSLDGELYLYIDGLIGEVENLSVFVDGEFLTSYGNASCVKVLNLGYHKAGDSIRVKVQGENMEDNFGRAVFVTEDVGALKKAYDELKSQCCTVTKKTSSHLIVNTGDCNGIFMTVPFEKGWTVMVDGRMVKPVAIYDSLTYIPIDAQGQTHVVDMTFMPVGIWIGVLLSLLGLLILVYMTLSGKVL
jgi:uncharacterized membrane protein YfhO